MPQRRDFLERFRPAGKRGLPPGPGVPAWRVVQNHDDRDAAEQAAAFLIGNGWDPGDEGDR